MPDRPFGSDSLAVPAYLVKDTDTDDPGLAAWKQEHPNWMLAGNWTPAPRPTPIMPPTPNQGRATPRPIPNASFSSLDPATISVTDFRRVAKKPHEPTNPSARSDQAYPDNPRSGMIPNVRATGGQVFHLPNGKPVPGLKPSAPTGIVTTPSSASAPETMATGREAERNFTRHEPPSDLRYPKTSSDADQ